MSKEMANLRPVLADPALFVRRLLQAEILARRGEVGPLARRRTVVSQRGGPLPRERGVASQLPADRQDSQNE